MGTTHAHSAEKSFTNSIGMELMLIPAGSFIMGDDKHEFGSEVAHHVTISKPFYMGKYEVTQAQWEAVMGDDNKTEARALAKYSEGKYIPSALRGPEYPVDNVSWDDVQLFIQRLNEKEGTAKYRLPTEAEWEYAARAGDTGTYPFGEEDALEFAWVGQDTLTQYSRHVGQRKPNAWGLYDTIGNVAEWVQDWYGRDYYATSPAIDPPGPNDGEKRVLRGGAFDSRLNTCGYAKRGRTTPKTKNRYMGFRLAATVEPAPEASSGK